MVLGSTDSRHYKNISKDIYRFIPVHLTSDQVSMLHGYNEKISIPDYLNMIQFYIQLINDSTLMITESDGNIFKYKKVY